MSFVSDTHSFDSFEDALEGQFELEDSGTTL
jgi:hypothetical protein